MVTFTIIALAGCCAAFVRWCQRCAPKPIIQPVGTSAGEPAALPAVQPVATPAVEPVTKPAVPPYTWLFCPWCASDLAMGVIGGKHRKKCTKCNFVHWDNPRPVAVVLIPTTDNGMVLIKRLIPPRVGKFALPGGFVEPYEMPDAGAIREAEEETGLKIVIDRLLLITMPPKVNEILFFYLAHPTSDKPGPADGEAEAAIYAHDAIPTDIAFSTHQQVIDQYLASLKP